MLGDGGHRWGKLEPPEVVAICDHLVALELEDKIDGKARDVALDLLVQPLSGHAVERGEVGVYHDPVAADDENLPGDARADNKHHGFSLLCDDALPLSVLVELPDHDPENFHVAFRPDNRIGPVLAATCSLGSSIFLPPILGNTT